LSIFPESGWMVEEYAIPTLRELVFGNYRIIYHYEGKRVEIIKVIHGARRLGRIITESDS
jgi:plasmid stabilization system protein ParE